MAEPVIAQKAPFGLELEPGNYWWCACGKSANQPFCDGSHKGGEFVPKKFELTEKKQVWICGCKKTGNPPYCDGTHKKL
jgi:CDGSH-type Zn-finger protein